MTRFSNRLLNISFRFLLVATAGLLASCEKEVNTIPKSDLLSLPSVTVYNGNSKYLDSGKLQVIIYAPLMEQYDNKDKPYSEFRYGIEVIFYDGKKEPVGSVSSKYARYTNEEKTWELRDSVVVINENKDMLETEVLNWDQDKDLIYTDRFVKITSEDQIIQGFGFESDSHLRKRKIKRVSATIYLKDEE
jgi:LPS export ABC transporter protein LptC